MTPDGSPSSGVTSSAATVPGKIDFGPDAAAVHPYFIRVREQIAAKWGFPLAAGQRGLEGDILIELRIAKDGRLDRVWLLRSSGVPASDEAALTAVQGAQPGSGDRVMDRRTFLSVLASGFLAAPLAAAPEAPSKVWRVAVLTSNMPRSEIRLTL